MQIITCAGYYGSGSSAITDFLSEFKGVKSLGDEFECCFIHEPYGISDLQFHIVDNYHRNCSGFALKKFKQLVDNLVKNDFCRWYCNYEKYFNGNFKKYSYEYINQLTATEFVGHWHFDEYEYGDDYVKKYQKEYKKNIFKYRLLKLLSALKLHSVPNSQMIMPNLLKNEITLTPYNNDKFFEITKNYLTKLFESIANDCDYLMVDQLVPPSNLVRYLNYMDNLKVVCVERDPVDVYLSEVELWHAGVFPNNAQDFVKWYRQIRLDKNRDKEDVNRVLRIKFEDFIYHYERISQQIIEFLGLNSEDQIAKFSKFDPKVSINNINLSSKFPARANDVEYIKENLKEYLYNFD